MSAPVPRVAVFGLDDHRLPSTMRSRLQRERDKLAEELAVGNAADWADCRYRVGVIRGIQVAIDICTEIEREQERR